ncbi:MAG: CDP-alcohol phosphatidyltransferase family protein [Planctomycetes bacterium]|nr:CDP-alcohol phosphatidyltransferase family protein [Planctomycetota bacterium]
MSPRWIRFFLRPANVATSLAIVAGLAAAFLAVASRVPLAAACLVLSGVLDMLDGPLARAFPGPKEARDLGLHLDSLADALNFGFAPAVLAFAGLGLASPAEAALLALFLLAVVGRLAAFNTFGLERSGDGRYYRGLPTTFAALFVPLATCATGLVSGDTLRWIFRALYAALAIGMVSPVRIRKPGKIVLGILLLLAVAVLVRLLLIDWSS